MERVRGRKVNSASKHNEKTAVRNAVSITTVGKSSSEEIVLSLARCYKLSSLRIHAFDLIAFCVHINTLLYFQYYFLDKYTGYFA